MWKRATLTAMQTSRERSVSAEPYRCPGQPGNSGHPVSAGPGPERCRQRQHTCGSVRTCGTPSCGGCRAVTGQHSSGPVPSGGSPQNPRAAPSFRQVRQPRCGRPSEAPGRAPRAARIPRIPVRARCGRPAPSAGPRHRPLSPAPPVPGTTRTGHGSQL